ncbi:MAG: NAD(P)H-dependent oxidoreductase [Candidatus Heimdallarchaeota archaeon]|nr:NAD(P)H-dependent oxidoreductase [Candidatus Heimdallarchaeota archaeon]
MKISIIFHSVCANNYLIAKAFYEYLKTKGQNVSLYRVADSDWIKQENTPPAAKENLKDMINLSVATPEVMLESDLIIMGAPTYFGNVSAEMKAYMDSAAKYWVKAELAGKRLVAFTSAGNSQGGGDLCLQAIQTFGMYMGMLCVPVPTTLISNENIHPFGIIHYSYSKYGEELDSKTQIAIKNLSEQLI